MSEIKDIDQGLFESLQSSFAAMSGARLDSLSQENELGRRRKPDAVIRTMIGNRTLVFVAETRGDVYPRDAREAVWQLKRHQKEPEFSDRHHVPMVIARSISDGARTFLRNEGVAYHDLSGSLYIKAEDMLVLIEKPKSKRAKRRDVNVFRGARAQVLHALFTRPRQWVTGIETARDAGVSPATVSQTFKNLERRDWLDVKGYGPAKRRRLAQPDAVLDAWRDSIVMRPKVRRNRYYVPRMKPEEMARQIREEAPDANIDLELTGQFAAQFYTPFLSSVSVLTVRVRGKRACKLLLSILGAREVSEGANLVLINTSQSKLSRRRDVGEEQLLATPLQVYLDLFEDYGRSKELAEHLRSQKLTWR